MPVPLTTEPNSAFMFTNPAVPMAVESFVNWLTDVTDATSTGFFADVAWTLSTLGLSKDGEDPIADSEVMLRMFTDFWQAYQQKRQ